MSGCYLERRQPDKSTVYRIPLNHFPALVSREAGHAVILDSNNVSRQHAEIFMLHGQMMIRDLGSTNGTFVNHKRIVEDHELVAGDVIRFADIEFRLLTNKSDYEPSGPDATATAFFTPDKQINRLPIGAQHLEQMLQDRLIEPFFQPIIAVDNETITGLELLGRGAHSELSESPAALFELAENLGLSIELSEAIREIGIKAWAASGLRPVPLYLNTHPNELKYLQRLIDSLKKIRSQYRHPALVLEIHEQAVTDASTLQTLNAELHRLNIDLAYDDFGAGQDRLQDLLSTPPCTVKFDISLIRNLDKAPENHREIIRLLVELVKKGDTNALAEGVSRRGELAICKQLGFDMIQGFIYGKPAPLAELEKSLYWRTR